VRRTMGSRLVLESKVRLRVLVLVIRVLISVVKTAVLLGTVLAVTGLILEMV
jgi:hypothetical protein